MFQQSLDDLGTPLNEVTFCVLDFETTGGRRSSDRITEIGAIKYQGGKELGTFQTLIDPGRAVPPEIMILTGITSAMVSRAPKIEHVLPTLLEFLGGGVLVGHNVGFDLGFLNAALERSGREPWKGQRIDTLAISRRLIRNDVPNHKLSTLARCLRLNNQPSHRALDDAKATADLLHHLLEQASSLGVLGLDDLQQLPKMERHPQARKLRLTEDLPRSHGVYRFINKRGEVLYVGKASNIRARVRSYFSTDNRRKVEQLLRETETIEHTVCVGPLQAEIFELRLIQDLQPRFNRRSKNWSKYAYVKLTLAERFPRLSVVSEPKGDGGFYLGPISSRRIARDVVDAIEAVLPLRRCNKRVPLRTATGPCVAAQIGAGVCPCSGEVSEVSYSQIVDRALLALTSQPENLLNPLRDKMRTLAHQQRFEEAADLRRQAFALSNSLRRQNQVDALRSSGRVIFESPDTDLVTLENGRLVESPSKNIGNGDGENSVPAITGKREIAELLCVANWLENQSHKLRLVYCDLPLSSRYPNLDSFQIKKDFSHA